MKRRQRRVQVDLEHLDDIVESTRDRTLDDQERSTLQSALHEMAAYISARNNTEKTRSVVPDTGEEPAPPQEHKKPARGHGRNGADAFTGAKRVPVPHPGLEPGCPCPECLRGRVYHPKKGGQPSPIIRFSAGPPIGAIIYELETLSCNLCRTVFRPEPPEEVGAEKYDETASSMVAMAKYGHGIPFYRLEAIQRNCGVPLPASTAWELVKDAAEVLKPVHEELIREAAQAPVLHSDDTRVRLIEEERPPGEDRTGQFTTGFVAEFEDGRRAAVYVSGTRHAGENGADLLRKRANGLESPVLMCDALNHNRPKMDQGVQVLLANCLAHGRRKFVELFESFPEPCRHVLEELGKVYAFDAEARERGLDKHQRLKFHKAHSEPIMKGLRRWLTAQIEEKLVEPNSRLGKAIQYLLTHWMALTLFLRQAGAPLDNNICERALKKVVLHRKNALFYRTMNGAAAGDLFMSLIHTCELNEVNAFVYLTELQRHPVEIRANPGQWMPWNYQSQLAPSRPP
jgi:transposase